MNQLETVLRLQQAFDELREKDGLLAGVPDWMTELHERHAEESAAIAALSEAAAASAHQRRAAEAAIQDAEAKLKQYQEQVSMVRTQREYAALLQEIDAVKDELRRLEDEGLSALEAHDTQSQEAETRRSGFSELDAEYQAALSRWETEKPEIERQAEILRRTVEGLRGELPRNIAALFQRLVDNRDGLAVAAARRLDHASGDALWHCSGCNYRIRLHVISQIRRGTLVQCDGCQRILHVAEDDS